MYPGRIVRSFVRGDQYAGTSYERQYNGSTEEVIAYQDSNRRKTCRRGVVSLAMHRNGGGLRNGGMPEARRERAEDIAL